MFVFSSLGRIKEITNKTFLEQVPQKKSKLCFTKQTAATQKGALQLCPLEVQPWIGMNVSLWGELTPCTKQAVSTTDRIISSVL